MDEHGWTVDTIREHLNAVIREKDAQYQDRFDSMERAVAKAEVASEKRFDSVNEFRSTLADQQRTLMPRTETEVKFGSVYERLSKLEEIESARHAGGLGVKSGWGWAVAVVALVGATLAILLLTRSGP